MGKVLRARDPRLGRDVAIKVSKAEFTERFTREARMVAQLNHPNICHLYDIGPNYLVMELVDGAPLKGPQPVEKAVEYAGQILDALDAAHRKGITHRDLKPANVLVTKQGIKLLDFGVAKQAPGLSPDDVTIPAVTAEGQISGTLQYMAPEQLHGKKADVRSDIFSFGCVLYEMLTSKRAFDGSSAVSVIVAIMERPAPSISEVAPPALDRVLKRCLEKDPDERWQTARDLKWELLQAVATAGDQTPNPASRSTARRWILAASVLAAGFLVSSWIAWKPTRPAGLKPLVRLNVNLGAEAVRSSGTVILCPDGTRIVYTGRHPNGQMHLYTRRLGQSASTTLDGTDSVDPQPFFSPDGQWIGFSGRGKIAKVAAGGGSALALGQAPGNGIAIIGSSWGDDNNIIFGTASGLYRIPGDGGTPRHLDGRNPGDIFPDVLPGSKSVLYTEGRSGNEPDIAVWDFATGQRKTLLHGGMAARFLPSVGAPGGGYLLYVHDGSLFGAAYDPVRMELKGTPVPILDDVASGMNFYPEAQFAFSRTGLLAYLSGRNRESSYVPALLDSAGKMTVLGDRKAVYTAPRFSPDGKRLAYLGSEGNGFDLWVGDLSTRRSTQLTFQGRADTELAWSKDSQHLAYGAEGSMWWIRADGSGPAQLLSDKYGRPGSITADGTLLFSSGSLSGDPEIWTMRLDLTDPDHPKPGKPAPYLKEAGVVQVDPAISPDGKFLAYASSETGSTGGLFEEVFVRSYPGQGGKWKISSAGGKFPAWSAATHELLFLAPDNHIMAVSYSVSGGTFIPGAQRIWSPVKIRRNSVQLSFDLSPDGKHVAMFPLPEDETAEPSLHAVFLLNFLDELKRRLAPAK